MLQPLLVRPLIGGGYQIVAGERRWRAARMAGVQEVPAVVRDLSESEVMQLALIENLQREDLNPLEEAGGYQALMRNTASRRRTWPARWAAPARPWQTRCVCSPCRRTCAPSCRRESSPPGMPARCSPSRTRRGCAAPPALAVEQGLSVRQLEKMAQAARGETAEGKPKKEKRRLPYYDEVELALHEHLGRRVSVKGSQKKGTLQIEFYGQEDLAELLKLFGDD